MKTPYEYRAQAREALQNRWGEAAILFLILLVIAMAITLPFIKMVHATFITTALSILLLPLQYSCLISLLERIRGNEEELTRFSLQYASNKAYTSSRFLIAGLIVTVLSTVVSVLTFGIGGIILAYMYSMVPYLLHDYPELTPREAMKISREMMAGQKWNLFVLDITFIGWMLLAIFTAGLGLLFVGPYIYTARAAFYEDLKSEKLVEEQEEPTSSITE